MSRLEMSAGVRLQKKHHARRGREDVCLTMKVHTVLKVTVTSLEANG